MSDNDRGPGELLGYGLLTWFVGGFAAAGLIAAEAPTWLVATAAAAAGLAGQVLVGIAVVAFGVSLGIRTAEAKGRVGSAEPRPRLPHQPGPKEADPDPHGLVPPWDTPQGRSYR